MASSKYNFKAIEAKWQKRWKKERVFEAEDDISRKSKKKKYYILEMFPYPSGGGLHMGHAFNYTIGDIYARFIRMKGFNVLYPMGYDSFGLPAENAAIKSKSHPKKFTDEAISNFIKQQKALGLSYDWSRMFRTSSPDYYKWNQFFFLQFFKSGLAYRKNASVNWCPDCVSVLANEQVHNGKCWRHTDTDVEVKQLEQWFLKITKYQEELLKGLDKIDWPERIKVMQKNWIGGESEGTIIQFRLKDSKKILPTFTTRPDTQFGVTCFIYAPEHPDVVELTKGTPYEKKVKDFIKKVVIGQKFSRTSEDREKEGMFIGAYAINPINDEEVPIYIANFVLLDYGTGAVQCVPAHDQRDYDFAKKYNLPIKRVIEPIDKGEINIILDDRDNSDIAQEIRNLSKKVYQISPDEKSHAINDKKFILKNLSKENLSQNSNFIVKYPHSKKIIESVGAFLGMGKLINSGEFNGLSSDEAKIHITKFLDDKKKGKRAIQFKLRDWLISRQRYWGTPIPVVYCKECAKNNLNLKEYKSYLMGGSKIISEDIESMDIKIIRTKENGDKELLIPNKAIDNYLKLVEKKLDEGFWNEVVGNDIKFIFKFKGGKIKRFILSDDNKLEIAKLCAYFNDEPFEKTEDLLGYLLDNNFYQDYVFKIKNNPKEIAIPVPEKDLPVLLPNDVKFGKGNPLVTSKSFVNAKCPKCKGRARRETDTMDTFFDSSWYFLRFIDPHNSKLPFNKKLVDSWMPVDQYIGGAEHACMHLIYARFFTKALRDLGFLSFDEPFMKLFNQGMLHGSDGFVMSKSRGNVVLPEEISEKYGIDTARLFIMSIASPDKDTKWSDEGIDGSFRFVKKLINYFDNYKIVKGRINSELDHYSNKAIKEVSGDIINFHYNLAIIKIREFFDKLSLESDMSYVNIFVRLLAPFAPHLAEEFWEKLGNKGFACQAEWPIADEKKINNELEEAEKALEKTIADIVNIKKLVNNDNPSVYLYVIPPEVKIYEENKKNIQILSGSKIVHVSASNDPKKHDPQNKSQRAKPGKPAIYIE